jgi:hypothetical protein
MIRLVHPGSGSCFFTHPESQIQESKRHWTPDPDRQHVRVRIQTTPETTPALQISQNLQKLPLEDRIWSFF